MLGRYKYRNRQYEEAIRLFEKVEPEQPVLRASRSSSRGISYVQLRKSVPGGARRSSASSRRSTRASRASRTRTACATSRTSRWRARTTRRRSARRRDERADDRRDEALRRGQVLEHGRRGERVLARRAVRGVVGVLHGRRLPARARQHPHDPVAVLPELVLSRSGHPQGGHLLHQLQLRRRDASIVARFQKKYVPIRDELEKILKTLHRARTRRSRSSSSCSQVREGKGDLDAAHQDRSSRIALSDRQLLRNIEYVQRARRRGEALQEGAAELPELGARQRRRGRAEARARPRGPSAPASSPVSATSATSTSSTSTCATARRSSSTSPPRSATCSTRRSQTGQVSKAEVEDLRRRQARRGARPLAVRRRVLARRARVLPAGRRVGVWEVIEYEPQDEHCRCPGPRSALLFARPPRARRRRSEDARDLSEGVHRRPRRRKALERVPRRPEQVRRQAEARRRVQERAAAASSAKKRQDDIEADQPRRAQEVRRARHAQDAPAGSRPRAARSPRSRVSSASTSSTPKKLAGSAAAHAAPRRRLRRARERRAPRQDRGRDQGAGRQEEEAATPTKFRADAAAGREDRQGRAQEGDRRTTRR